MKTKTTAYDKTLIKKAQELKDQMGIISNTLLQRKFKITFDKARQILEKVK